ncbi:MAG TPA: DUF2442 domain-containing protein [Tepidisphaeraceae bacterium]|nr:DUF2442 domain-containing protein [Tepidisphaeraceae bacterium]
MPDATHPIHRVRSFKIEGPYTLRVCFEDQTEHVIDFQGVLGGEICRPLRDLKLFNQVRLDPEVHTLTWPNGADFDPAMLYDWPRCAQEFAARAKHWDAEPVAR